MILSLTPRVTEPAMLYGNFMFNSSKIANKNDGIMIFTGGSSNPARTSVRFMYTAPLIVYPHN